MERGAQAASSSSIRTRIAFGSHDALISVNVWTGAPLLAVWMGSKAQGNFSSLSMGAVALTVIVLAVLEFGLVLALSWVNARYDQAIGRPPLRRRYPWHSSMRGAREELISQRQGVRVSECMASVMV